MTKEDIMTAQEICEILGIEANTLYGHRYRDRTGIPVYKVGKYLFANRTAFFNWYNVKAKVA